jgi:hypothetical protein
MFGMMEIVIKFSIQKYIAEMGSIIPDKINQEEGNIFYEYSGVIWY